jgi:hypothetical protein
MNHKWWNSEIICIVLEINQRYFISKNVVEMFSAYIQEANLTIFNLFYLHFCVGPHVCIGNSSLRIFAVCLGVVVSETSSFTHTSFFRHTSLTTFLFPPLADHTRHFGWFTVTDWDRPTFAECHTFLPTCPSFPVYHSRGWIEDLYMEFPYPRQGKNKLSYTYIQYRHMFVNFGTKTFVFHGYVLSENDPSFEQNNFVYDQTFGRAVKFWKFLV